MSAIQSLPQQPAEGIKYSEQFLKAIEPLEMQAASAPPDSLVDFQLLQCSVSAGLEMLSQGSRASLPERLGFCSAARPAPAWSIGSRIARFVLFLARRTGFDTAQRILLGR